MKKKALQISFGVFKTLAEANLRGVRGGVVTGTATPNGNVPWPEPPPVVIPPSQKTDR
jgi:hypothetical protein